MFNEQEWLRLLFLLSDTQSWLDDMSKDLFSQLPVSEKKKFMRKNYFLTAPVLAHILERHYYKIARYPQAGKFTIPVADILHFIREAGVIPAKPLPGYTNFQRSINTGKTIGYDKNGKHVETITILTDGGGKIVTAFPGPLYTEADIADEMLYQSNGLS